MNMFEMLSLLSPALQAQVKNDICILSDLMSKQTQTEGFSLSKLKII